MKKLLASLLVISALLSCMIIGVSAGAPGGNSTYVQGTTIWGQFPLIWTIKFAPTDITGAVSLKFDLYVSKAADFKMDAFEVGSEDACDTEERQFGLSAFGALQDGWNTVTMSLNGGEQKADALFNFAEFKRIRMFRNVERDKEANVEVGLRNIVAVKEDGTEIKIGNALDTGVLEGNVRTYAFELYQESEEKYLLRTNAGDNKTQRFSDGKLETVYAFGMVDTDKIEKVEFSAKLGCQLLLQVSNDDKNWVTVYEFVRPDDPDHPEAGADIKVYDFDLTDKWTKGDALFIRIADSSPEDGWGGSIFKDNVNTLKVTYKSDAPVDPTPVDPTPTTFDAVSSVAVAAVAALGIALVASKKRH
ncbi:MAG: hypothetical protein MJ070_07235 [Lachnospiraceae bacterium]|nr:hypothetical protein [Lachnospiraceae bacterium]